MEDQEKQEVKKESVDQDASDTENEIEHRQLNQSSLPPLSKSTAEEEDQQLQIVSVLGSVVPFRLQDETNSEPVPGPSRVLVSSKQSEDIAEAGDNQEQRVEKRKETPSEILLRRIWHIHQRQSEADAGIGNRHSFRTPKTIDRLQYLHTDRKQRRTGSKPGQPELGCSTQSVSNNNFTDRHRNLQLKYLSEQLKSISDHLGSFNKNMSNQTFQKKKNKYLKDQVGLLKKQQKLAEAKTWPEYLRKKAEDDESESSDSD